ncbi:hypothetical protein DBV05_g3561 [Lasiodiplodia theobromae]|uniref:Uncharacterized protein n=1 Tax=Lasiodiplodia theobromae TaxID=45133 RepID=A0A5N5DIZ3_9PEZI|nr:hypothetical protein DBV05_g3561 [Lasiodiplodia theobromae]
MEKPENATLVLMRVDTVAPPSCPNSFSPALVGGGGTRAPGRSAADATAAVPAATPADTGLECKSQSLSPSSPSSPHTLHSFTGHRRRLSRTQSSPAIPTAVSPSSKMLKIPSFSSRRSTDVLAEGARKPSFAVLRRGRMASVEELAPEQQVGDEELERRRRSLERRTVVIRPDPADDGSPPYTKEEARRIRHAKRKVEGDICCDEEWKPDVAMAASATTRGSFSKRVRAWVIRSSSASLSVADDQKKKRDDMIEEFVILEDLAAAERKGMSVGHGDDDANPYGVIEWREGRPPSRESSAAVTSGSEADDYYDNDDQQQSLLNRPPNKAEWAATVVVVEKKQPSPQPSTPTTGRGAAARPTPPLRRQTTLESIIHKVPFLHHHHRNSDKSTNTIASARPPPTNPHDHDDGFIDHSPKPSSSYISEDADNKQQHAHPSTLQKWFAQPHSRRAQRAAISSPDEFFDLLAKKHPLLFANMPEVQDYVDVPGPSNKLERLADDQLPQLALDEYAHQEEEEAQREHVRTLLHEAHELWVNGALVDYAKYKGWRLDMDWGERDSKKAGSGGVHAAAGEKKEGKERKDSAQGQTAEGNLCLKKVMEGMGRKVGGVFTRKRSGLAARVGMGEG